MDTKPVTPFPMAAGQIVYVVLLGHVLPFVISEITFSADPRSPIATADQFAMVTTKANAKLSDEMSAALKTLKANGKFEELHQKWFGRSADPDLP